MSGKTRVIGRRASPEQKEALLLYLEENLMFANFLCDAPNANEILRVQWETVADLLNKINGAQKLGASWRKYWFDLREYTKKRLESVNNNSDQSEYKKMIKNLTVTELRIINIINWRKNPTNNVEQDIKFDITKIDAEEKYSQLSINDFRTSRIKTGRASDLQKQQLVKYFEENPDAIRVANNMTGDSKIKQRVWIDLTHKLNSINGTMKTSSKWAKYWCDIVNYTRNRAKRAISHQITAANDRPPTDIEKRMLIIVGQKNLLDEWVTYWSQLSTTSYKIKFESDGDEEEESQWIDLSNDDLDEQNSDNNIDTYTATAFESKNDIHLVDVAANLDHTNGQTTTTDEFENVCYDDTTIEFAECTDSYYQVPSNQHTDDAEFLKESSSINNLNEPDDNDIIDESSIIMDERINSKESSNNNDYELILSESLQQQQPPRKKKKTDDGNNENNECVAVDEPNCSSANIKSHPQNQIDTFFSDNNNAEDESCINEEESEDDYDLSAAVYALSAAASSMATALKGLAKVLKKRKTL